MAAEGSDSSAASVLGRRPTCYEESEYWNLHMGDIHREDSHSNLRGVDSTASRPYTYAYPTLTNTLGTAPRVDCAPPPASSVLNLRVLGARTSRNSRHLSSVLHSSSVRRMRRSLPLHRARGGLTGPAPSPSPPTARLRSARSEGNLDGVRVGLGHRFAAAWVRVRAAFGDG